VIIKKILPWALLAIWMGVIFAFSAQSGDVSDAQTQQIQSALALDAAQDAALLRKAAHVLLFFVLGGLALWACGGFVRGAQARRALAALGVCAVWAALDELHQAFVPQRTALLSDVLLDTLSAGAAILAASWARRRIRS
jgi:VanZ family protein